MAWSEEQQPRTDNGEWPDTELLELVNLSPSEDTDERAQHGASNFQSNASQSVGGLTYSASCPSFSGLEESSTFTVAEAGENGFMSPSQEPLEPMGNTSFPSNKSYNMLLQFQQEYQNSSHRQFPHQQAMRQPNNLMPQQISGARRGFHGSQSFTNLPSMETEYKRLHPNSKRKMEPERWLKLQRHKSFDSSTSESEASIVNTNVIIDNALCSPSYIQDQLLNEPPESDTIGFSIDDVPNSNGLGLPSVGCGSASGYVDYNYPETHLPQHQSEFHMQFGSKVDGKSSAFVPAEVEPESELDLLLSETEQANLFDAIRDFDAPSTRDSIDALSLSEQPSPYSIQTPLPIEGKRQSGSLWTQEIALSPEINTKSLTNMLRPLSCASSMQSGTPPCGCIPMRARLHQILVHSVRNSDAGSSLSSYERNYLMQSPLFSPAKATETAGSLWLLLHAAQCDCGCDIAGCSVMRRVLNHCLGCELVVGKCKQICNDAKAMLLHYGSCNSKGSLHGRSCSVCWNLLEIDYSHQALSNCHGSGHPNSHTPSTTPSSFLLTSPAPRRDTPPIVPMSMSPCMSCSPATHSPLKSATNASKHVPIQPNPLPTASNPMGVRSALPPHFDTSLSLHLEQMSALFRAEVKSRVEKRVTAAAGQDLLQHMQKKTRLRSLDDLRSEARGIVLEEMERELRLHGQAYNWANSTHNDNIMEDASQISPYLRHVLMDGFRAVQSQYVASQPTESSQPAALNARRSGPLEK